ncbi:MAG: alpha-amylase family glycosyl hydrolase [Aggregatilineales bacterium]
MDFIFGTMATDELKLLNHRLLLRGVHHGHDITPLDPLPGQAVTVGVRVGMDIAVEHVALIYTTDDSIPVGSRGVATNGMVLNMDEIKVTWDSLAWGFVRHFEVIVPAQEDSTVVRYIISAWKDGEDEIYADYPDTKSMIEHTTAAHFAGKEAPTEFMTLPDVHVFNYHVDTFKPPKWSDDAVIYHVFVDRFYPGDGQTWKTPDNLMGFFGGTLWGVRDKLDYIADLGATCIWLSPVFVSESHHGYDALDYYTVEPRLGGNEALKAVIEGAHARGIKVLLDLACNHVSSRHEIFQSALNDPESKYRDWFTFDESALGYRAFFGVADLPELNVRNLEAKQWMIDIALFWLREYQIDGYRLDYAHGCGPDFWTDFRKACRAVNPETLVFGEIVEAPDAQIKYYGRLDGALDFQSEDVLRKRYGWGTMSKSEFERFMAGHRAFYPEDFVMPTFLDNHDMDRFLFIAGGDKEKLRYAAQRQFSMRGIPVIYYGTEVGLTQEKSARDEGWGLEVSRLPMLWGEAQDAELREFYKDLISKRKAGLLE